MNVAIKTLIYAYSFLICFEYLYVELFGFDSELKPYRIVAILIIILLISKLLISKMRIYIDIYDKLFGSLFALGLVLAVVTSIQYGTTLKWTFGTLLLITLSFLVSIAAKNVGFTRDELKKVCYFFIAGTVVNVFYSIYSALHGSFYRISGFYKDPAIFGTTVLISIIFLYKVVLRDKNINYMGKLLVISVILSSFLVLLLSGSRTAFLALFFVLLAYLLFLPIVEKVKVSFSALLVIGAILVANNVGDHASHWKVFDRYNADVIFDSGGAGRLPTWRASFLQFLDRPFIGLGTSQFRNFSIEYANKLGYVENTVVLDYELELHSNYISALIEYGIFGFIIFIYINYRLLKDSYWSTKVSSDVNFSTYLFLIVVMIIAQGFTQGTFVFPMYLLFISLIATNIKISRKEAV